MATNFIFNNGGSNADFSDVFIPVSAFAQGQLWIWGDNNNSQLGDGTFTGKKSSPVQTISGGINWKQVACGPSSSAAIKTDGTLWLWGRRQYGNMGNNVGTAGYQFSPVQTVSSGTNWQLVSAGYYCVAAIKTDGTLWTWGQNAFGGLGDNTNGNSRSSPVQTIASGNIWKQVSTTSLHTGAIKTDGTLWLWGRNQYGQLGNNSITNVSSPIQTISGGTNWKLVTCGTYQTAAIKTDGTLWLWGDNAYGQLGTGGTTSVSSPIQTISGGTNWKLVTCGRYHTAAIKTDGTLWLWGKNNSGQLGTGNTVDIRSPVQTVSGGTNWKQVTFGSDQTASIKTDGTLWTWGLGNNGQLGNNNSINVSSPVQTAAGGTNWKQVSTNTFGMAAVQNNF
jgi:alpha-tubulin suppressor-like RCC1 family protein